MTWGLVIRVPIWMYGCLLQVLLSKKHYEHQASGDSQNQRLCSLMAMHLLLCAVQRGTPCSLVVVPTGRTLSIRAGSLTDPTRQ